MALARSMTVALKSSLLFLHFVIVIAMEVIFFRAALMDRRDAARKGAPGSKTLERLFFNTACILTYLMFYLARGVERNIDYPVTREHSGHK